MKSGVGSLLVVIAICGGAIALLAWAFFNPPAVAAARADEAATARPNQQPAEEPAEVAADPAPDPGTDPGTDPAQEPARGPEQEGEPVSAYVLSHTMPSIAGEPVRLDTYRGKVLLVVNVASKCGLTPQYEGLEALYRAHKDRGLVVLGFPANNFGSQEPGTNEQIAEFCSTRYDVTFPMFAKISVTGEDPHPLFAQLAAQPAPLGGEPTWNFTKFLVNRSGEVVARFEPRTAPNDPHVLEAIEKLLAERAPAEPTAQPGAQPNTGAPVTVGG